jgi:tight adherence protein B
MNDTLTLDRQLGDLVWMITTALRAGYSFPETIGQLAREAPEPAANACARLAASLNAGLPLDLALADWCQAIPSRYLGEVVAAVEQHQQAGGNLASQLEPVGERITARAGSDPAFWPAMRRLAESVRAPLPRRAVEV